MLGFAFFKPGVLAQPGTAPAGPAGGARTGSPAAPVPGGMDPGMTGEAMMGQVTEEITRLKSAVAANPADVASLVRLGDLFFDAGKYDESRGYYEQAAIADPHDPQILTSLGLCWLSLGDPQRALEQFREANRHDREFWPAAAYAIVAGLELGDVAVAEEALGRMKSLNPSFEHLRELEDRVVRMKAGHAATGS